MSFTGTGTTTARKSYAIKGAGYAFKESSHNNAATVYAMAETGNYTTAIQGQVDGMVVSMVAPGS